MVRWALGRDLGMILNGTIGIYSFQLFAEKVKLRLR